MSDTNNTKKSATETAAEWFKAGNAWLAAHPHIVGVTGAAMGAALSHFYYRHSPLTVAAWAVSGFVAGEALSRVVAHAKSIQDAATNAKATAEALKAAAAAVPAMAAAMAEANAKLAALEEEMKKLRQDQAAAAFSASKEAEAAAVFRAKVNKAQADADAEDAKAKKAVKAA
jgi:hypothetical protein